MPRQGPRRLPAGERDRRLAEEVLYLHSLWRRGPHAPGPVPIQSRSARREELDRRALRRQERERLTLYRVLRRKERKRRRIDRAAAAAVAEPALALPPPASSQETLAEAAGASAPSTSNPPPPKTPPGPLAQREAVPSSVGLTNRDSAGDYDEGSDSDRDKEEEEEAARYFAGLFERDAWLRGHYTERWREGRFQCMVCAAGGGKTAGKAVRRFRGCLALVQHAHDATRARGLCGRYGRRGAHRALAAVVCRLLGWDFSALPRIVIDPRATAGVQHAKENDGAGENNGYSTEDDSYSIDEDEESEDDESVDEEEDIEIGMPDPATDGDDDDSEIESDEEYAEKEDHKNRMEESSTDGDEDVDELEKSNEAGQKEDADTGAQGSKIIDGDKEAIELDNCEKIPEKEAANSIARKRDMKRLTHAKPVETTAKKTEVRKRNLVPKHKEVSTPGSKFNEGSVKGKRKASALSYQGLKSSKSGVVKKVKVNQQPNNKGKQSKTNETGASARKAKRPAVAARKAKQLAKKRKVDASTPENTHRS